MVLSSNDGCVVARSQEVKDSGIPMGVPYFQVKDTLKDSGAAVFSSNFTLYRDISARVMSVLRELVVPVEQYSIDEAFFLLDEATAQAQAAQIRSTIEQRVGIPVSVGVAPSKTLAKLANRSAKAESGVAVWSVDDWHDRADQVALGELWGVAGGRSRQFAAHGLHVAADLMAADRASVRQLFGVEGERLYGELHGRMIDRVTPARALQKSLMSSRSFRAASTDPSVVSDAVAYHVRRVAEDLRGMHAVASRMTVSIRPSRHGDFILQGGQEECVFTSPTNSTAAMLAAAQAAVQRMWRPGVPYQKAGITVADIQPETVVSQSLFPEPSHDRSAAVEQVVDTLNHRFGLDTVTLGRRLQENAWKSDCAHLSPHTTTNWANLPSVTA